ncbi:MAG TPA: GvpL/GvpF family gas vesicle protein [Terriglobales bacterium]
MKKQAHRTLLYLYGISDNSAAQDVPTVVGVDPAFRLQSAAVGDLAAWYSEVDAHDFGDALSENMENLEWLADTSVRHQRAVAAIAERTAIVPARFGTVFVSLKNLSADVAARAESTRETLSKITGAEEWGVKVRRRTPAVAAQSVAAASGTDYLRKKAALQQQRTPATLSSEVVEFADALAEIAIESAAVGKLSSGQRDLEWQAAFLVRKSDKRKWEAALRKYAKSWGDSREIECTGPWPPYSFV